MARAGPTPERSRCGSSMNQMMNRSAKWELTHVSDTEKGAVFRGFVSSWHRFISRHVRVKLLLVKRQHFLILSLHK
ncbi:uncharacterized protein V6R79_000348 [Siganus canaliculatus]